MKNPSIKIGLPILLGLMPFIVTAQELPAAQPEPLFYPSLGNYMFLSAAVIVVLIAMIVAYNALSLLVRIRELEIYEKHGLEEYLSRVKANEGSWWSRVSKMLTGAVPIEKEGDILLSHNYDGIRELDNRLPPWWLYGFYLTIVISIIYIGVQHFSSAGKSSTEEYEIEMAEAKASVEAYLAKQADQVDETNVAMVMEDAFLAEGENIFKTQCAACHLDHGGGGPGSVGPNLTDDYWIHGGSIKDVFSTIKYGVPEKGMISWKTQLRPVQMHQVASYIMALQGTDPPNAKEPQGELYIPREEPAIVDTTSTSE